MNKDLMPYDEYESPFDGMMNLREAMQQMMSEALWDPFSTMITPTSGFDIFEDEDDEWFDEEFPKVDVKEKADKLVVSAEIPGVKPDDIDITIDEDLMIISGITGYEDDEEDMEGEITYTMFERFYGTFERAIALPAEIETEKVAAEIENGVLTVVLPKLVPDTPKKKIAIKVKSEGKTKKSPKKKGE